MKTNILKHAASVLFLLIFIVTSCGNSKMNNVEDLDSML